MLGHRHDVPDLLCAADVLAIPSLYEGTAGAAIEAMALRCPVVCTDVEGVRGILRDGVNALLVPAGEPALLADGLVRALHDDALADALRCRALADFEDRFTIEAAAARMEALYAELTRGRPVEERGDEVAGAGTRVPPGRRGLVEAHRSGGCASSPTTSIDEPEAFAATARPTVVAVL